MKRPLHTILVLSLAAATALTGCSPSWYQRDADLQVEALLKDRKKQTLAYEPDTTPPDDKVETSGRLYERIPVTPIPVSSGHTLEPATVSLPYAPLGPVNMLPPDGGPMPEVSDYRSSARDRAVEDSLVLGPISPRRKFLRLDLFGALTYATQHSREYKTSMESVYLAALDVTLERHLLSPRFFAEQSLNYNGTPSSNTTDARYQSALSATSNVGVRQRLPYGGEVVAQGLVNFVDALNSNATSGENAQVALSASVPLLRGAGFTNLEGLISSEREVVYTIRDFETFRRRFLVDVASNYFNLLTSRSAVLNRRLQLENQIDLVERSRALYAAGKTNYLDVQRSINSQISGETSLIQAEEQYRASLDSFKLTLGMPIDTELEIVPIELDVSIPEVDPADAVKLAQLYRLDVATARDQIDDAKRRVNNAKNGLLPDLNMTGRTTYNSLAGEPANNFDSTTGQYSAGVTLGLPLDRVAERNTYRRTLIQLQQAQRSYELSRDNAEVAARNALRRIRSARDRVELQKTNVQISEKRLELANQLLRAPLINPLPGLSSSNRDVVEAQQGLISAQDSLDQARATLQIQVLNYYRDTGTLRIDPSAGTLGRALARAPQPRTTVND